MDSMSIYYNIGWRAHETPNKILVSPVGAVNDLSVHPTRKLKEHLEFWYNLKTYQDSLASIIIRGKKKRFLPSVNPLGDTAAFSNWNGSISLERGYTFRHRKGGRRG
jgi:hypothetical protein